MLIGVNSFGAKNSLEEEGRIEYSRELEGVMRDPVTVEEEEEEEESPSGLRQL